MVMSASEVNTPDENRDDSTNDDSWYILDETGDTQLGALPKHVLVARSSEDVNVDLTSAIGDLPSLSSPFKQHTKEVLTSIGTNADLSSRCEDVIDSFSSTEENKDDTAAGPEMNRRRQLANTPNSSRKNRQKLKNRKRKSITALFIQNQTTPRPGKNANKNKKRRKKSVILIDSDSEPDDSVIEIPDESVIVLSDDEVGVCSGTVTKPINQNNVNRGTNLVVEDSTGNYILPKGDSSKEVASSTNTQKNSELYHPTADQSEKKTGLRPIVIDGCNVAFGHGRDRFSSLGLKICVDYFKKLGHEVRVFIPQFRKHHNATADPHLLDEMEKEGVLCYTPSRRTDGRMIVSYDDRFIVQYADANGGVVVSKDNYRDLLNENPEWKETINKRLLMYTWVGDTIMFPKDPLGRHGPTLQEFLKF